MTVSPLGQPIQYVSPQRIARDLDVSESYVRKAMDRGELRYVMLGGRRRIAMAEYRAWHDTLLNPKAS